jgi:hypothetical protein
MDLADFRASLSNDEPPAGLSLALQALWWDAKGDWNKAHECAQAKEDDTGNRVHAYLHRKEGDAANAGYWYRRSGRLAPDISLGDEWEMTVRALLEIS